MKDISHIAGELARIRWSKTTPEQRKAHASKMGLKSAEARKRRKEAQNLTTGQIEGNKS